MKDTYNTTDGNFYISNIIKLLLTLGFCLISINFLILFLQRPSGYVVDIYSVLPIIFNISLTLGFLFGTVALLFARGVIQKFGVLLLILNHSAVLAIPFMLGYYSMGRADDMSYIGEYLQISGSGQIGNFDIYPASHIIGASVSIVTSIAPNTTAFILPFIFSFLFIGGLVLCCRSFLENQDLINIAIPASFILYLGPYNFLNVPHAFFFAMMPLALFVIMRYIRDTRFPNLAIITPFLLLVPFMHPFIVLFVTSILSGLIICGGRLRKFIEGNYHRALMPLLIVVTEFLAWFSYNKTLNQDAKGIATAYYNDPEQSVFIETTEKLSRINLDIFKLVKLLLVYYGRYMVPVLVISIALVMLSTKRISITRFLRDRMFFLVVLFLILLGIQVMLFFNPIISHQPDRLTNLNFVVYALVPLFAISLSLLFGDRKFLNWDAVLLLLVLSGTWGLSFLGAFDSPNTFRANVALTHNEVEGMVWYYESRDIENVIVPLSQIGRFRDLFGDEKLDRSMDILIPIGDHFGYTDSNLSFVDKNLEHNQHSNVILFTTDELLYQKVPGYMEVRRYTANDYIRFRSDRSVSRKVYDNTDIEIYYA